MTVIKRIAVEDFGKDRLQVGQSERYSAFKVAITAEAGAENVGRLLQQGAIINDLEDKQQQQKEMEQHRTAFRNLERARASVLTAKAQLDGDPTPENAEMFTSMEKEWRDASAIAMLKKPCNGRKQIQKTIKRSVIEYNN
jgi:hypothetical protein